MRKEREVSSITTEQSAEKAMDSVQQMSEQEKANSTSSDSQGMQAPAMDGKAPEGQCQ